MSVALATTTKHRLVQVVEPQLHPELRPAFKVCSFPSCKGCISLTKNSTGTVCGPVSQIYIKVQTNTRTHCASLWQLLMISLEESGLATFDPRSNPAAYMHSIDLARASSYTLLSMSRRANAVISFKLGKSFMVCPSCVGYACNGMDGAKSNPILSLLPQRGKSRSTSLQTRLAPSCSLSAFTQADAIGFSNTHDAKAKVPWKIS